MATRIDELTPAAQPFAIKMAERCGTLKNALSAGIIALSELPPEKREGYISRAKDRNLQLIAELFIDVVDGLDDSARQKVLTELQHGKKTVKPVKSA